MSAARLSMSISPCWCADYWWKEFSMPQAIRIFKISRWISKAVVAWEGLMKSHFVFSPTTGILITLAFIVSVSTAYMPCKILSICSAKYSIHSLIITVCGNYSVAYTHVTSPQWSSITLTVNRMMNWFQMVWLVQQQYCCICECSRGEKERGKGEYGKSENAILISNKYRPAALSNTECSWAEL